MISGREQSSQSVQTGYLHRISARLFGYSRLAWRGLIFKCYLDSWKCLKNMFWSCLIVPGCVVFQKVPVNSEGPGPGPLGPAHWAQPNWAHWAYWAHLGQFGFACVYACCFVVYVWVLVCICVYMCVFIVRMRVYLCVFTICLCICLNQISLGAHGRSTNKVAKCELRRRCSSCTILQKTTMSLAKRLYIYTTL